MIRQKPKLEKGREYRIQLYPQHETVNTNYLGEGRIDVNQSLIHIFSNNDLYIFVNNHFMEDAQGTITHNSFCSFIIQSIKKDNRAALEKSGLIKLLKTLGVAA